LFFGYYLLNGRVDFGMEEVSAGREIRNGRTGRGLGMTEEPGDGEGRGSSTINPPQVPPGLIAEEIHKFSWA